MLLMTKAIEKALPPLYSQEEEKDPMVRVKYFSPYSNWTWWATEYNPLTKTFFGLVKGFELEWGYFTLAELTAARWHGIPAVERDLYFTPKKVSEIPEAKE
jgi:hypothetical protein